MKRLPLIFILVFSQLKLFSQPIEMYSHFGGMRFQRDTLVLSTRQVSEILSVDPVAVSEFRVARSHATISGILGFAGGFLLAFPLGTAAGGGEPEWALAGVGGALLLASIPFSRSFKNHAISAVEKFNSGQPSSRQRVVLRFSGNGALVLKF